MRRLVLALTFLVALGATPAAAGEWQYDAALYGWLTGLEGTIGLADVADVPVDASFSDLAGFLDFAMAAHFDARNATTVLIADVAFFNLGNTRDATVGDQPVTIDLDLQEWILEGAGGYRATPEIDILLAGRYYIFETGAASTSFGDPIERGRTQDWGDIYLGARYTKRFKEKWMLSIRGDIGAGGSDFAWFGNALVGYQFTKLVSASVGYRILSLDREANVGTGSYFKYDVVQDGAGIGLGFSF